MKALFTLQVTRAVGTMQLIPPIIPQSKLSQDSVWAGSATRHLRWRVGISFYNMARLIKISTDNINIKKTKRKNDRPPLFKFEKSRPNVTRHRYRHFSQNTPRRPTKGNYERLKRLYGANYFFYLRSFDRLLYTDLMRVSGVRCAASATGKLAFTVAV